jgi:hypothetical protein
VLSAVVAFELVRRYALKRQMRRVGTELGTTQAPKLDEDEVIAV